MDNVWLLSGIGTAIIIIIVLVALLGRKHKGDEEIEPTEESGEEYDDVPETEPEIKRGVVTEKYCFVDKDGTFIPNGAERSWVCFVVKIETTDGASEECLVEEEDYASVEEGEAVTFMKQGDKFLGFGKDIEE